MSLINLDLLFNAISGIAQPLIKEKVQRNETVIKLLKQFKIDPEHPPGDFSGVYAYTLVEYGVGKPKPILELFRQQEIKAAFRKAFDHNNPSILLSEVDAFVDAYALGDEIKNLRIDIKREIAAFYIVFSQVAKLTRNPASTMMSQQIGSLHTSIFSIQEQLERMPTLEGIRTEIARLAAQNYSVLSENAQTLDVTSENQCRAIALAQQMRGWFETLGYSFENHEVWAEEYFEFIINIPVRRSFDRILVRGIAGEIGLSDVMALRSEVQEQKTDEGWLVTTRRISRAARDEVKKEENRYLDCFTFDELIDLDADFSGYVDWLEAEIKRRKVDTKYVSLACTKEELDPLTKQRIGVSRYEEEDGWIDGYIDLWLDDPVKEHISILGEFGTGKTWFTFHYAWTALQRYKDAQRRGKMRPRLPVVITLRDFAKALNVENVLAGFFFTQHNIRINSDVFDQLNRMGKLLLIFDGFDEMAAKVDRQQMINNFWELAKVVVPGAKVILTCRTEHFPEAQEGRALLNAELQASTKNLTGETPQFEVLELEKFNDEQIRQVLLHQAEAATVDQVMDNPQLLDLARRPVMTDLILEALPDIEAGKPVDMSRVYLYAVRRKMERDIKAERTFTSLADKLYFLCELSWEMLSNDQMSINYKLFPDRIRRLFGSMVQEQNDLDHWHYDMMGQTMLIRNANGDYTPAHRSLLEFFVAYKFAAELGALADDFTELASSQSCLDSSAVPVDYTWSGYFERKLDNSGNCIAIPPLKGFISESLEKLRENFGRSPLTKAVMDLMLGMVEDNEALVRVIELTRGRSEEEVGYVGGNAVTLMVKVDEGALVEKNFNSVVIKGADFSNAILQNVNFENAEIKNSSFTKALNTVLSVTFSLDGTIFATSDTNGDINLWRFEDNERLFTLRGHIDWVRSISFNHNGSILASGSEDTTVKLWNPLTGKCLRTLEGHINRVYSVSFSANGRLLASGSEDTTVKLWDVDTGKLLLTLIGHVERVDSVSFSPDNNFITTGSTDNTLRIWSINTGKCILTLLGHTDRVRSVTYSPDDRFLASCSSDSTVRIWDASNGQCLKILQGHNYSVRCVAYSPDGRFLASCSSDSTIRIWDASNGQCLKILQGHNDWIRSIAFNPQGNILISGGDDQKVKFWEIDSGECFKTLQGYHHLILSLVFSSDGHNLISGSNDGKTRIWNIETGKYDRTFPSHGCWLIYTAISSNGETLACGYADGKVKLWDMKSCEEFRSFQTRCFWVLPISFSFCNQFVAFSNKDTIEVWNVFTGEHKITLQGHSDWIECLAFSPNENILASGSADSSLKIWNIDSGELVKNLEGHCDWIWSLDFAPDGKTLASGSYDKTLKIWNIQTGECIQTLEEHISGLRSICFSPDGKNLVSGGYDRTIGLTH